jgi:hypothetical protein
MADTHRLAILKSEVFQFRFRIEGSMKCKRFLDLIRHTTIIGEVSLDV